MFMFQVCVWGTMIIIYHFQSKFLMWFSCALKISDIMFNLKLAQALALNSSPYFIILQHDSVAY